MEDFASLAAKKESEREAAELQRAQARELGRDEGEKRLSGAQYVHTHPPVLLLAAGAPRMVEEDVDAQLNLFAVLAVCRRADHRVQRFLRADRRDDPERRR